MSVLQYDMEHCLPVYNPFRMPLRKRGPIIVEELLAQLAADPAYRERERVREEEQLRLERELAQAEASIVAALHEAGYPVQSVWDLVNTSAPYPRALPILLQHLQQPYPLRVRQGIARAMAVPASRFAWETLLKLFKQDFDQGTNGLKWCIGCALAAAADDSVIQDVIDLFGDPRHGRNRIVFATTLERSRAANAQIALEKAREDPQLAAEVRRVLDRRPRKRR